MKNSYSYKYQGRNYTTNNSFIQEGNDFSKYIKHKKKKICLNDIPFKNNILFKNKDEQKLLNEKFSYFKKVIDRTFNNSIDEDKQMDLPLYNISKINNFQTIIKSQKFDDNRCNSTNNIKIKNNKNKDNNNYQTKQYINKNYNRVFGNEEKQNTNSKCKLSDKINKMKKKIGNIENIDIMNRPKIKIKEPHILNDYNDISISVHRKYKRLIKIPKRNCSHINININNKNKIQENMSSHLRQSQKCIPNLTSYKNNNSINNYINILNHYNNQKEIENFKKSFLDKKFKNHFVHKFVHNNSNKDN